MSVPEMLKKRRKDQEDFFEALRDWWINLADRFSSEEIEEAEEASLKFSAVSERWLFSTRTPLQPEILQSLKHHVDCIEMQSSLRSYRETTEALVSVLEQAERPYEPQKPRAAEARRKWVEELRRHRDQRSAGPQNSRQTEGINRNLY